MGASAVEVDCHIQVMNCGLNDERGEQVAHAEHMPLGGDQFLR